MHLEFSLVLRKFLEQALVQSTDREIRKGFPVTKPLHISGKCFKVLLKKRHNLGLFCIKNPLFEKAPFK